jgi:hypothetical protein
MKIRHLFDKRFKKSRIRNSINAIKVMKRIFNVL